MPPMLKKMTFSRADAIAANTASIPPRKPPLQLKKLQGRIQAKQAVAKTRAKGVFEAPVTAKSVSYNSVAKNSVNIKKIEFICTNKLF